MVLLLPGFRGERGAGEASFCLPSYSEASRAAAFEG